MFCRMCITQTQTICVTAGKAGLRNIKMGWDGRVICAPTVLWAPLRESEGVFVDFLPRGARHSPQGWQGLGAWLRAAADTCPPHTAILPSLPQLSPGSAWFGADHVLPEHFNKYRQYCFGSGTE